MKGIRNNLLNKDIAFTNENNIKQYASWEAITAIYEIDKFTERRIGERLLNKLIDKHIYAPIIPKMKVKYAVQALSSKVATLMETYCLLEKGKQ